MINIAFCDDEISTLEQIHVLLKQYQMEKTQEISYTAFHSPLELLAEFEKGMRVDILLLDVIMPGENGIDVAREVRQYDQNVKIIFLTSSSEFAVQSYTVGAFFYQLKPIWRKSFFRLLDSVIAECSAGQHNSLILQCKTGLTRIELDRLEFCEVIRRVLLFHMESGQVLESVGSLDELEEKLIDYSNFVRPHRSFLINMEYIQNISYRGITMENCTEIPLPHGKYSEMKRVYLEYMFCEKEN